MKKKLLTGQLHDHGFQLLTPYSATLTELVTTGAAFVRPIGAYELLVTCQLTITGGSPDFGMIVQGSMDGTNWTEIERTKPGDYISTNGAALRMNSETDGIVRAARWAQLRIVLVGSLPGAPADYDIAVAVTCVPHDGERFLDTIAATHVTGATTTTATQTRKQGVQRINVQGTFTGVVLGGITAFTPRFQVSPDGSQWHTVSSGSIAANGFVCFTQSGEYAIDLGGVPYYRVIVEETGGASGPNTAFTLALYYGYDDCDWLAVESPASGGVGPIVQALTRINASAPAGAAGTSTFTLQVTNFAGAPILAIRQMILVVADTQYAGDADLSATATFGAIIGAVGTLVIGAATNRVVVRTNALGRCQISVLEPGLVTRYVSAVGGGLPHANAFCIVQSDEVSITYA